MARKATGKDSAKTSSVEPALDGIAMKGHNGESEPQAALPRSYVIPILSKALTIIDLIESSDEPLSARQIHERLGYSPATIYRILRTLSAHGVLKGCEHTSYSFRRIEEVKHILQRNSTRLAK